MCKYYYELETFFGDRPSARPPFPNWTDGSTDGVYEAFDAPDQEVDEEIEEPVPTLQDLTDNRRKKKRGSTQTGLLSQLQESQHFIAEHEVKKIRYLQERDAIEDRRKEQHLQIELDRLELEKEVMRSKAKAAELDAKAKFISDLVACGFTKEEAIDQLNKLSH